MKSIYSVILVILFGCGSSESEQLQNEVYSLQKQVKLLEAELDSNKLISDKYISRIDSLTDQLRMIYTSDTTCFNDPNQQAIETVNHIFYHSVIMGRATPMARKQDGYARLMVDRFIEGLQRLEIFDSAFISKQRTDFQKCADDIEKMKFTEDMELGWEPGSCFFFNYYYYIGGQEAPQYYFTTDLYSEPTKATAKIKYFDIYKKEKYIRPQYLNISYVNFNGEWRIQKAELIKD